MNLSCRLLGFALGVMGLFLPGTAAASLRERELTRADGLPSNSVRCMMQDSRGVTWIGSWSGVCEYDSHSFRPALNVSSGMNLYEGVLVSKMAEQRPGVIWAVSWAGVSRIDWQTRQVRNYLGGALTGDRKSDDYDLSVSSDGQVFCSAFGSGLYRYDESADKMIPFHLKGVAAAETVHLFCASDSILFLLMADGSLQRIDYHLEEGSVWVDGSEQIFPPGSVQLGMENAGFVFFVGNGKIWVYSSSDGALKQEVKSPDNWVTCLTSRPDGTLFALCGNEFIFKKEFGSDAWVPLDVSFRKNTLFIYSGMQDILWAGVDNQGLVQYYEDLFPTRHVYTQNASASKGDVVHAFAEDLEGNVYASTQGGGIYSADPDGNVRTFTAASSGIRSDYVSALAADGDLLYIGCGGGIDVAVCRDGSLQDVRPMLSDPIYVYSLCLNTARRELWAGTLASGVVGVRLTEDGRSVVPGSIVRYTSSKSEEHRLPGDFVSCIVEDVQDPDYLFVATIGGGLSRLRKSDGRCERIATEGGMSDKTFLCMLYDRENGLWMGGDGLYRLENGSDGLRVRFVAAAPDQGDVIVRSIQEDASGKLWVTAGDGISCFDKETKVFTKMADCNDLGNIQFSNHASFKDSQGRLYFGGVNGYNVFSPEGLKPHPYSPTVLIRSFSANNVPVKGFLTDKPIRLSHDENLLEFSFSAVDYLTPDHYCYFYRLKGESDAWINNGTYGKAVFSRVRPGRYEFQVRSTNNEGQEYGQTTSLRFVVRPPWYLTILAFLSYFVLLTGIVCFALSTRRKYLDRKRAAEEERAEIDHQKSDFLMKLDFFNEISNEFGSSITLVSGYADQLSDQPNLSLRSEQYIDRIRSGVRKMNGLIRNMAEFRDVGAGKYAPVYEEVNAEALIRMIARRVDATDPDRQVRCQVDWTSETGRIVTDANALEKIVSGILSFLHARASEESVILVSEDAEDSKDLALSVCGECPSVRDGDLLHIFDRYGLPDSIVESPVQDPAFFEGLALVRNYVTALQGRITAGREASGQISFRLRIPLGEPEWIRKAERAGEDPVPTGDLGLLKEKKPVLLVLVPDEDVRELVKDILSDEFILLEAVDKASAIASLQNVRPGLILVDAQPDSRGDIRSFVQEIKANEITKYIPMVALSFISDKDAADAVELDQLMDATLQKPFQPNALKSLVRRILRSRSDLKDFYKSSLSEVEMFAGRPANAEDRAFMLSLLKLIADHLSDAELGPAFLAEQLCMTNITLYRRIKDVFQTTPVNLIRMIRLRQAERLIRTTDLTISEVMFHSGFNNRSYFNKKFIEEYGMPPKQYRQRHP